MTSDVLLVTGGGGFIGSHLVAQLLPTLSCTQRLRILDRPGVVVDPDAEAVVGDIRDRECVRRAMNGVRQVYHLAANPQLWTKPRGMFRQVNFLGTVNVLNEAIAAGAERILHTSTESILTRVRQKEPIREDQVVSAKDVIGPYCRSKYLAERYAFALAARGYPVLIVNPTLPIGPGDVGLSPPTKMILDFCLGKRKEYLDAELNLIDVRDVAQGMIRVMQMGKFGRRYLLGNENLSIREVFALLSQLTGIPEPTRKVPFVIALIAACLSEILADVWTHQVPAATLTGVLLTQRRMHFDARASLAELGLTPSPIRDSLADAVAWFRQTGRMREQR
jgi:dihydroflavonol-4-reductase